MDHSDGVHPHHLAILPSSLHCFVLQTLQLGVFLTCMICPAGLIGEVITTAPEGAAPDRIELLRESAEAGSVTASIELAKALFSGTEAPLDYPAAEKLLRAVMEDDTTGEAKVILSELLILTGRPTPVDALLNEAAEMENANALVLLGVLALRGTAEEADYDGAKAYFEKAAKIDPAVGYYRLGWLLAGEPGFEDKIDLNAAIDYLEKAFTARSVEAGQLIKRILSDGKLLPPDPERSIQIIERAADQSNVDARQMLSRIYQEKGDLATAIEHCRMAAIQGSPPAQNQLAVFYAEGHDGVPADQDAAKTWFEKAAEQGFVPAYLNLALFLKKNQGDPAEIARLARRAADDNFLPAIYTIGVWYRDGEILPKDPYAAEGWFRRAAQRGFLDAQVNLAHLLEARCRKPGDFKEPLDLYTSAAKAGHPVAHLHLGRLLSSGRFGEENRPLGYAHLAVAAESGLSAAEAIRDAMDPPLSTEEITVAAEAWEKMEAKPWKAE